MKNNTKNWIPPLATLSFMTLLPLAQAATMSWGTASNIAADSDVSTLGSLVTSASFGRTDGPGAVSEVINGVMFAAASKPDEEFVDFSGTGFTIGVSNPKPGGTGYMRAADVFGAPGSSPFSTLSGSYQSLLSSSFYAPAGETMTLTLTGLTIGEEYLFQSFVNDSRGGVTADRTVNLTTGGSSVTLDYNASPGGNLGGLGQYAIGTFTADAVTQQIAYMSADTAQVQAFQLRAIPEPSSFLLGGISLLAFARRRR